MQLYRFIKKPNLNGESFVDNYPVSEKYTLYAITSDKALAKRFQEERDMNQFIVRKSKVTREEFSEFALMNRQSVLTLQKLITVDDSAERPKCIQVEVLLTQLEYQFCTEPMIPITDECWWTNNNVAYPFLFNNDIKKSLEKLDYINLFFLYNGDSNLYDNMNYDPPNWEVDQLSYFIHLFGDLFKIK